MGRQLSTAGSEAVLSVWAVAACGCHRYRSIDRLAVLYDTAFSLPHACNSRGAYLVAALPMLCPGHARAACLQADAIVHVHVGTKRVLHVQRESGNRINTLAMRADGRVRP